MKFLAKKLIITAVYAVCLLLPQISASSGAIRCSQVLGTGAKEGWKKKVFRSLEELRIERFNEALLSRVPPKFFAGDKLSINRSFFLNKEDSFPMFEVKKWLGQGEEGEVYLVKASSGQLMVLKYFYHKIEVRPNQEGLARLEGVFPDGAIKTVAVNVKEKYLLLEYVKGEPLSDVLSSPDLPGRVKKSLSQKFENLVKQGADQSIFGLLPLNVIVREKDQKLIIIDPF